MTFYRVNDYRITRRGERGAFITIPNTVLRDLGGRPGAVSRYTGGPSAASPWRCWP
jgi:hypothetical protein